MVMEEPKTATEPSREELNELLNGVRAARALITETDNNTLLAAIKMLIYQLLWKPFSCSDSIENFNRTESEGD